jgi:hypothetical protein
VKDIRFWAPIIYSIPVTIVCFFFGAASAGVGHGSGLPFAVLFPYWFALLEIGEALRFTGLGMGVGLFGMVLLVLQYPLYGLVIGIAWLKGKLIWAATVLIALHLSIAGYFIYDSYFPRTGELHGPLTEVELEWPPLGSPDQPLRIDRQRLERLRLPDTTRIRGNSSAVHRYRYLTGMGNCVNGPTFILYYPGDDMFSLIGECHPMGEDRPVGPFRGDPRKVLPQVMTAQ